MRFAAIGDEIGFELEQQLEMMKQYSIKYMEIRKIQNKALTEFSREDIKSFIDRISEQGIKVSAIASPVGKKSILCNIDKEIEEFDKYVEICEMAQTKYMRIFSYYLEENERADVNISGRVYTLIGKFLQRVKGRNLILLIENDYNTFCNNPKTCVDVMNYFKDPQLQLLYDPSNFVRSGYEINEECLKMIAPFIRYFHIRDTQALGAKIVLPGEGNCLLKQSIESLKKKEEIEFYSFEPHMYYGNDDAIKRKAFEQFINSFITNVMDYNLV